VISERFGSAAPFAQLLVGNGDADDAAVLQLNEHQALDGDPPIFSCRSAMNPFDFGRIAGRPTRFPTWYAMGGTPILALALLAVPIKMLRPTSIRESCVAVRQSCAEAGIPIAGGHSIDSVEPSTGSRPSGLFTAASEAHYAGTGRGCADPRPSRSADRHLSAALKKGQAPCRRYRAISIHDPPNRLPARSSLSLPGCTR